MKKKQVTYHYSYWLSQDDGAVWDYYPLDAFHSFVWPHIPHEDLHSFYCKIRNGRREKAGIWLATATRHPCRTTPIAPGGVRQ